MPRHERRAGGAGGFTLLEILVALIIFALLFGVLAQIFQTGLRHARIAGTATGATALARAQLARVGVEVPLAPGEISGESEDGMRWRTAIARAALPAEDDAAPEDGEEEVEVELVPWVVEVSVEWGPGESERLTLTTLRVAPPPE